MIDIKPIDLEPISVPDFMVDNVTIQKIAERNLQPRLDETLQVFLLEDHDLGIDLAEETRSDLEGALRHLLPILWADYARAPDTELTKDARELKYRLLAAFTEGPRAAAK